MLLCALVAALLAHASGAALAQSPDCASPGAQTDPYCREADDAYGMDGFETLEQKGEETPSGDRLADDQSADPAPSPEASPVATTQEDTSGGLSSPQPAAEESTGETSGDTAGMGGIGGMVLDWFQGILQWIFDNTVGALVEAVGEALRDSILPLEKPSGEVVGLYRTLSDQMRPAILVGILVLGLLMMIQTTRYDVAYASFSGLPRLLGAAVALAFLPQFMEILTGLSTGISAAFFPDGAQMKDAYAELWKARLATLVTGTGILSILLEIGLLIVGFLVVIVAMLKNIIFNLLFIAAPFALVGSLLPGLSSLAASWFRGVLACAAIPVLWAIEIGVGVFVVRSPGAIFGDYATSADFFSDGIATTLAAILVLWIMYKTPFKLLEWAFNIQLGGGLTGAIVKGVAIRGAVSAVGGAVSGLKTAMANSAAGAGGAGGSRISPSTAILSGGTMRSSLGGGTRTALGGGSGGGGQLGGKAAGVPRNDLPPGGSSGQKALPPASTEAVAKFLKDSGSSNDTTYPQRPRNFGGNRSPKGGE